MAPDADPNACPTRPEHRLSPRTVGATWTYHVSLDPAGVDGTETLRIEDREQLHEGAARYRERWEATPNIVVPDLHPAIIEGPRCDDCVVVSVDRWSVQTCTEVRDDHAHLHYSDGVEIDRHFSEDATSLDERPERLVDGAVWNRTYFVADTYQTAGGDVSFNALPFDEQWTVIAASERVTVPAGSFDTLHLHTFFTFIDQGREGDVWYAAGVGMVRRVWPGDVGRTDPSPVTAVEELTAYSIP